MKAARIQNRRNSTTLRDLAKAAAVSEITVSRALRGMASVNEQTRSRIVKIAEKMGYLSGNGLAMSSASRNTGGKTKMHRLRLVFPVFASQKEVLRSDFHMYFLKGLRESLAQLGGSISIVEMETLDDLRKALHGVRVHGFVLRDLFPVSYVEELKKIAPVVATGSFDLYEGVSCISHNERRAAASIRNHLVRIGHRSILWMGSVRRDAMPIPKHLLEAEGTEKTGYIEETVVGNHGARYAAWRELSMCRWAGIDFNELYFDDTKDSSEEVFRMILSQTPRPTAIVTPTVFMGQTVISGLRGRGYRVPEDFSVVAYGLKSQAKLSDGTELTIMDLPLEQQGRAVPDLISRQLANPSVLPLSIQMEATLHTGNTVCAPAVFAQDNQQR